MNERKSVWPRYLAVRAPGGRTLSTQVHPDSIALLSCKWKPRVMCAAIGLTRINIREYWSDRCLMTTLRDILIIRIAFLTLALAG